MNILDGGVSIEAFIGTPIDGVVATEFVANENHALL